MSPKLLPFVLPTGTPEGIVKKVWCESKDIQTTRPDVRATLVVGRFAQHEVMTRNAWKDGLSCLDPLMVVFRTQNTVFGIRVDVGFFQEFFEVLDFELSVSMEMNGDNALELFRGWSTEIRTCILDVIYEMMSLHLEWGMTRHEFMSYALDFFCGEKTETFSLKHADDQSVMEYLQDSLVIPDEIDLKGIKALYTEALSIGKKHFYSNKSLFRMTTNALVHLLDDTILLDFTHADIHSYYSPVLTQIPLRGLNELALEEALTGNPEPYSVNDISYRYLLDGIDGNRLTAEMYDRLLGYIYTTRKDIQLKSDAVMLIRIAVKDKNPIALSALEDLPFEHLLHVLAHFAPKYDLPFLYGRIMDNPGLFRKWLESHGIAMTEKMTSDILYATYLRCMNAIKLPAIPEYCRLASLLPRVVSQNPEKALLPLVRRLLATRDMTDDEFNGMPEVSQIVYGLCSGPTYQRTPMPALTDDIMSESLQLPYVADYATIDMNATGQYRLGSLIGIGNKVEMLASPFRDVITLITGE